MQDFNTSVSRYNIYFAYKRSKINKNIHGCAVNCVCISLLLQQLVLLFFNTIRIKDSDSLLPPRAIFSITAFTIFSLLFLAQMFFHAFKVDLSTVRIDSVRAKTEYLKKA